MPSAVIAAYGIASLLIFAGQIVVLELPVWELARTAVTVLKQHGVRGALKSTGIAQHLRKGDFSNTAKQQLSMAVDRATPSYQDPEVSLLLLINLNFAMYALLSLLTVRVFLSPGLTAREMTRMSERLIKYAVYKLMFMAAIISTDSVDVTLWMAWLTMAGYMRIFVGAAEDRLESLMAAPASRTSSHVRAVSLLLLMLLHNVAVAGGFAKAVHGGSLNGRLLCAFDACIVGVHGVKTLLRYGLFLSEHSSFDCPRWLSSLAHLLLSALQLLWRCIRLPHKLGSWALLRGRQLIHAGQQGAGHGLHFRSHSDSDLLGSDRSRHEGEGFAGGRWGAWEGKGAALYHLELAADVAVHVMTLAHYSHIWTLHGLSFHLIDLLLCLDMLSVTKSLHRRVNGYLSYRLATHNLQHAFPDVHVRSEEGGPGSDNPCECTICLESIKWGKRLPCSHVYHLSCLRALLQQSGADRFTCPLCRTPLHVAGGSGNRRRRSVFSRWSRRATEFMQGLLLAAIVRLAVMFFNVQITTITTRMEMPTAGGGGGAQGGGRGGGGGESRRRHHAARGTREPRGVPLDPLAEAVDESADPPAAPQRRRSDGIAAAADAAVAGGGRSSGRVRAGNPPGGDVHLGGVPGLQAAVGEGAAAFDAALEEEDDVDYDLDGYDFDEFEVDMAPGSDEEGHEIEGEESEEVERARRVDPGLEDPPRSAEEAAWQEAATAGQEGHIYGPAHAWGPPSALHQQPADWRLHDADVAGPSGLGSIGGATVLTGQHTTPSRAIGGAATAAAASHHQQLTALHQQHRDRIGAGPSQPPLPARRSGRLLPSPAAPPSTWSGDSLAAVARGVHRAISGDSTRGAVAGNDDVGEEVSSPAMQPPGRMRQRADGHLTRSASAAGVASARGPVSTIAPSRHPPRPT